MSAGPVLAVVFGAALQLCFSSVSLSVHRLRKCFSFAVQQSSHHFSQTVSTCLRPKRCKDFFLKPLKASGFFFFCLYRCNF